MEAKAIRVCYQRQQVTLQFFPSLREWLNARNAYVISHDICFESFRAPRRSEMLLKIIWITCLDARTKYFRANADAIEQPGRWNSEQIRSVIFQCRGPARRLRFHAQDQRGAGLGVGLRFHNHQN